MFIQWWKEHLSDKLVGLDIGPESIKLLKINVARQPWQVESFSIVPLPAGVTLKEKDYPIISSILEGMFKNANGDMGNQVALCIPRSAVIIKNTTIDGRFNSGEIESRIWIEANRHFPDLVGEIYLDYNALGPNATNPKQIDVMFVASRKDQIKPYLELMHEAGLTAKVVDVNCYALERALNVVMAGSPTATTVALLNLDVSLGSLIVSDDRTLIFAHDQAYNGRRLLTEVQAYLANEEKQPADPAIKKGSLQDPGYLAILKDNLGVHIRHTMHFFYSSRPAMVIQQIMLAGDLATIPDMTAFIQQEINIPTTISNPFVNMEIASNVDEIELKRNAPALMLCYGLALSKVKRTVNIAETETADSKIGQINLLPWKEQERQVQKIIFSATLLTCALSAIFLVFLCHFYLAGVIHYRQMRNDFLQSQLVQTQTELAALEKQQEQEQALLNQMHFIIDLREQNFKTVRLLDALAILTSSTVSLTKITRDTDVITIEGMAQSDIEITLFMKNLAKSMIFQQPVLTGISPKKVGDIVERSFQLKLKQRE